MRRMKFPLPLAYFVFAVALASLALALVADPVSTPSPLPEAAADTLPPTTTEPEPTATVPDETQVLAFYEALSVATTTTTAPPPPPPPVTEPPAAEPSAVAAVESDGSGLPPESYWDRMAQCETGGNWAHFPYGTWTGGLGIYNQTWIGWGGSEFAPTAGQATREQQIVVANRIATQGYGNLGPAGYSAWGCLASVGYP